MFARGLSSPTFLTVLTEISSVLMQFVDVRVNIGCKLVRVKHNFIRGV